jgi:hypothetical protein
MAEHTGGDVSSGEAGIGAPGPRLPASLLSLINPSVLAARRVVIQARAADPHDPVRRRRVAEIVANSLLEDLDDAA